MSKNTGIAPAYKIAAPVPVAVWEGTNTSSPLPIPSAFKE